MARITGPAQEWAPGNAASSVRAIASRMSAHDERLCERCIIASLSFIIVELSTCCAARTAICLRKEPKKVYHRTPAIGSTDLRHVYQERRRFSSPFRSISVGGEGRTVAR